MKTIVLNSLIIVLICASCTSKDSYGKLDLSIEEIPTFSEKGGEPNLSISSVGEVLLSWVEYKNDSTDVLKFSRLENNTWSRPQVISEGSDWFVNWADFPSLNSYKNSNKFLAAHWLQKSSDGVYDYDVRIAQSSDAGKSWKPSFILHNDKVAAEHGFVSMLPLSNERMLAVWLDGRETKSVLSENHHNHNGPMTLRTAEFDIDGNLYNENELDDKVCDCCQTDITLTDKGPLIVYRDRSDEEFRDISYVRKINGNWSEPKLIYRDNWKIAGCPVNGPAIDAIQETAVVAWYTMKNDTPKIQVSFSFNSGDTFEKPIEISSSNSLGRIDVILFDDETAGVSWVDNDEESAEIKFTIIDRTGEIKNEYLISETEASRSSGFPRLVKLKNKLIFAWTHIEDEKTLIKSAIASLE